MNILVIGFRNIRQNIQNYYNFLANYDDLDITLVVPASITEDEILEFKDLTDGKIDFIVLDTQRVYSFYSFRYIQQFKIKDIVSIVEDLDPDIIEISDNADNSNIYSIIVKLREVYKNKKILLNLWKNPIKSLFDKGSKYIEESIKKSDFILIRSELVKNYYTKTGIKTPYKMINFPHNPEMNLPDREYDKDKVSISIEIDKKYRDFLIFFDYVKNIRQNVFFYCRDDISYSFLRSKGFECEKIGRVSDIEKNNMLTESDMFIYLKDFDMEEPQNSDIIKSCMFLKIPVFLPAVFPYNEIYKEKVFFMQEIYPEDFERLVFNRDMREKNISKAFEYMKQDFSMNKISSQVFNIYLFLYKISRITSTQ